MPFSLKPKHPVLSQIAEKFRSSAIIHPPTASSNVNDPGPRLIEDLVPLIIAARKWTQSDLLILMRVSPAWLFPIRRLLYSHIHCSTLVKLKIFTHSLVINHSLGAHVRHFRMELYEVDKGSPKIHEDELNRLLTTLFSRLTHLERLTVKGPIAVAFFQHGLLQLPNSSLLKELAIEAPSGHGSSWVAPRMRDRTLTWTRAEMNIVTSLTSLKLDGVSLTLALPPSSRGLPPTLQELTLRNATISNPHSFTVSSNLTRITVVNELDEVRSHNELLISFGALLEMYSNTLEYLSYSTPYDITSPFFRFQGKGPLTCLRILNTDGVYFNFDSPEMILHKCPRLEEWTAYQQRPESLVEDFMNHVDIMPSTLRKVVFSQKTFVDTMPYGPPEARSLDAVIMEQAREVGRSRDIKVIFEWNDGMA